MIGQWFFEGAALGVKLLCAALVVVMIAAAVLTVCGIIVCAVKGFMEGWKSQSDDDPENEP